MTTLEEAIKHLCNDNCDDLNENIVYSIINGETGQEENLLKYKSWRLIETEGIYDTSNIDFTESSSPYRDGVINQSSVRQKREIKLKISICGCTGCSLQKMQRELYKMLQCLSCKDNCTEFTGKISFCRKIKNCYLSVKCCDTKMKIPVRLKSIKMAENLGRNCATYDAVFQADNPSWMLDTTVKVVVSDKYNTVKNNCFYGVWSCYNNTLKECFDVNYTGDLDGVVKIYMSGFMVNPKITINNNTVDLNRQSSSYFIPHCRSVMLDFTPGNQVYRDNLGNSVYENLSIGACVSMRLLPCKKNTVCIEASQVSPDAKFYFAWDTMYDSAGDL